jgi:hypothetical protein
VSVGEEALAWLNGSPAFDAAKYKQAQRAQWNSDGAAWRRSTPTLERWYGVATRRMLDLARLQPGQRILDVVPMERLVWTSMLFPGYRPAVLDDIPTSTRAPRSPSISSWNT